MVIWAVSLCIVVLLSMCLYGAREITRISYFGIPYTPKDFHWTHEALSFSSRDGLRLTGWFIPARAESDATILIQHGRGSNAGDTLLNTRALHERGRWNLLYFNFRGHGDSEGRLTSLGTLELGDMECALDWLKREKPSQSRRIAVYGHSLGGAVAIVGAARHPEILGVAAESPFASTVDTIRRYTQLFYRIPSYVILDIAMALASLRLGINFWRFAPVREVGKLSPRPLLIIQAALDRRAPLVEAEKILAAAGDPKELWVVPEADHGQPWEKARQAYEDKLVGFFEKVFI